MVYLSFCKEWKYKTSDKTCRCFRCQYNREWASLNLEVTEKDLLSKVKQILLLSDSYEK